MSTASSLRSLNHRQFEASMSTASSLRSLNHRQFESAAQNEWLSQFQPEFNETRNFCPLPNINLSLSVMFICLSAIYLIAIPTIWDLPPQK